MRIHHLNCVSACPLGGALMDGVSARSLRGRLTSHCLLLELDRGLVLVDTGYGLRDVHDPKSRLARFLLMLDAPELREEMTAIRQIEALGFDARDVTQIVLSHLDYDHAGGLDDFPHATVHLLGDEIAAASAPATRLDRMRYRPQQWIGTRRSWQAHAADGDSWFGFECVRDLPGVGPDVLLVPLAGHTLGHAGVAIHDCDGMRDRWVLYAGDAYFFHLEMDIDRPRCPLALRLYQAQMDKDRRLRLYNQRRLRELRADLGASIDVFCAHDVVEFERMAGRAFGEPARRTPIPSSSDSLPEERAQEVVQAYAEDELASRAVEEHALEDVEPAPRARRRPRAGI
jgi:glyoxylase-like metal-dependent hydrolase (beta-lactamase superfamily II)